MTINFYCSDNEKNVIDKALSDETVFTGILKGESSITDPIIMVETETPILYNYAYIPQFNRYYFITGIISVRVNLWEIHMHVDVLMSFSDAIKNSVAVMESTETEYNTPYLDNGIYKTLAKDKTDIISFQHGFLDSGEYILITAGGDS